MTITIDALGEIHEFQVQDNRLTWQRREPGDLPKPARYYPIATGWALAEDAPEADLLAEILNTQSDGREFLLPEALR